MFELFCVLFIGLLLLIFLGPYRVCVQWEVFSGEKSTAFGITGWKNLYGIRWVKKRGKSLLNGILMKKSIPLKIRWREKKKTHIEKKQVVKKKWKREKQFWCFIIRMFSDAPKLAKRILRNFKIESCDVSGNFGIGDPGLTGKIYGLIQSARHLLCKVFRIELKPDFIGPKHEARITLTLRFVLIKLIFGILCSGVQVLKSYRKCKV